MSRIRPALAPLLALLLVLQWGAAFAHCLRPLGAEPVTICGPGGPHTVLLDAHGKKLPPHHDHATCPLCQLPVADDAPLPPQVAAPAARVQAAVATPIRTGFVLARPRGPPQGQPRPPPAA